MGSLWVLELAWVEILSRPLTHCAALASHPAVVPQALLCKMRVRIPRPQRCSEGTEPLCWHLDQDLHTGALRSCVLSLQTLRMKKHTQGFLFQVLVGFDVCVEMWALPVTNLASPCQGIIVYMSLGSKWQAFLQFSVFRKSPPRMLSACTWLILCQRFLNRKMPNRPTLK